MKVSHLLAAVEPRVLLPALVFAGVLLWTAAGIVVYVALPDWPARGQFGDMFGAINALFSGLALGGVIYAVLIQHAQLKAQERDLKLNARLNAMAALIAAYTERARYFDSRASPNTREVNTCEERIREIADKLEALLKEQRALDA